MAGDDLKKVQRGQALRMPASAYNAFIDAAADYRRRSLGIEGQYKQRDSRSGVVIVRNQSGSALDQFAVVELGSVIIGPSDNEQEFRSRTTFDVTTPAEEPGPMAILQEPIAADGTGRAMVFGVTPVRVDVTDEEHEYAEVTPSEPGYLTSAATGAARVLYKESGTGEVWAVVYFPASSPGGPLRLSGFDPDRADGEPLTQCDDGADPEPNEVPLNEALRIIEVEADEFRLALNLESLYVVDPVTEEFEPLSDILRFPHLPAATQVIGDETEGTETPDPTGFAVGTDDKGLELWQQTRMGYFHDGDHKLYMYVRKALFDERGCLHSITGETRVEIDAPVECDGGGGGTGDMLKSVYDTDDNGLVDAAEALDDGVDYVSAGDVRTHIDDEEKHREINDAGAGLTDLWSASKITDELAGKADTDHSHVAADVTDFDTEVGNHPDVAANTAARHARQHGLNVSADHTGIPGTPNNFMALDASGLPKDSGSKASDFAATAHTHVVAQVTDFDNEVENNTEVAANSAARHAQKHGLNSLADHNGIAGTPNNLMGIDANGLPKDSGAKSSDFAEADHTHLAEDVIDFDDEVGNHPDVSANTDARYKVKATAGDASPGYLSDKVVGAAGSVIVDGNKVQLEGDGIPYYPAYYGTQDDTGAKTWYPLPFQVRADIGGEPDYLDGLVQKSIVENATDHKIELDGDEAAPGANKVYGTDGGGNKGWQDAGGGDGTVAVSANDTTPGYLLGKLVGDTNWLATEEVNNGGDEDLKLKHVGPHAPTTVQTIGAAAEGNETAEGSSFVVGTGGNGLDFWVLSRIGYFHAGDKKLYMYARKLTVDETGHVRSISGETRVEIEAPVVEG